MGVDHGAEIKVAGDIRVGHHHVLLLLCPKESEDGHKALHSSVVYLDSLLRIGRENVQAAVLAGQVPLTSGSQMIHQRMVVLAHNDGNVADAAVHHAGQHKVDHAVTAGKGDGSHQALAYQFRHQRIMTVWENNTQSFYVRIYHCSSPPFTLSLTIALGPIFALSPI